VPYRYELTTSTVYMVSLTLLVILLTIVRLDNGIVEIFLWFSKSLINKN
jgi:hypothetical protein